MTKFNEMKDVAVSALNSASQAIDNTIESVKTSGWSGITKAALGVAAVGIVGGIAGDVLRPAPAYSTPANFTENDTESSANNSNATEDQAEETSTETEQTDPVEEAVQANAAKFREAGGGVEASEKVARQEVSVFLGAQRGEIVGERADAACIIKTQEGKFVEEFTKSELAEGMNPDEAKAAFIAGLCNAENGVNVPAVATQMAQLEAMKNNIDINAEFDKVNTEMTIKYIEAMKNNPDLAQVYLETVQKFLGEAEFGAVTSVAGQRDTSIYTNEEGHIVTVDVLNKEGAVSVPINYRTENLEGVMVEQTIDGKRCLQLIKKKVQPAPTPEAPVAPTPPQVVTPPTETTPPPTIPPVYNHELKVCVGLDEDGNRIIESVRGEGSTQEEAIENAQEQFDALEGDCEVVTTTSTTTTTIYVTSSTSSTTIPVTITTVTTPSSTTSTSPDKITTTTVDQPDDPDPTVPEVTVPDDTRPPATVGGSGLGNLANFASYNGRNNSSVSMAVGALAALIASAPLIRLHTKKKLIVGSKKD